MRNRLFFAALLASTAAFAGPRLIGLYPLPAEFRLLAPRLHDAVGAVPGVRAYDLIAHSACAPDEGECLAGAARRAGLDAMISADVTDGRWYLREFAAADGALLHESSGDDLARAACEAAGGTDCRREALARVAAEVMQSPVIEPRQHAARALFGAGLGLLVAAAGVGVYSIASPSSTANDFARGLAITGAGALAAGGLVVALTPSGISVSGSY